MASIIGHHDTLTVFDRAVACGSLSHAYLLAGPRGVGKTTMARWMAQRLLCQEQKSEVRSQRSEANLRPCGCCPACVQVERGVHPDVVVVRPEDGSIGVDAVRAWAEMLRYSSLLGGWKVGIVEEGAAMTVSAANALLKLLEEPSSRTLLVVTAQDPRAVLPTIASRCATVRFHRVSAKMIAGALAARGVGDDAARTIVALADGCPGRAYAYAADGAAQDAARATIAQAKECIGAPMAVRLQMVDRVARAWSKEKDLLRARADVRSWIAALTAVARAYARRTADHTALQWCTAVARAPRDLDANVAPRLVLEAMVVAAPL